MPSPAELNDSAKRQNWLDWIERVGNKLPDPITLFVIGCVLVLICSEWAARTGWSVENPQTNQVETVKSLLSRDGMQWAWRHLVENFTGFAPLGVVLVGMIGIGVAEQSGLIGALLKGMVLITPQTLLTPAVIFVGVMSSIALDAGYIVLPPLACAMYAKAGRSPLVGLGAVFAGIGAGFSANLSITGLDPLLQSFTQESARILLPDYLVDVRCNWYFMIASTLLITGVGWITTARLIEPRYSAEDIARQNEAMAATRKKRPALTNETAGENVASHDADERMTSSEVSGLLAATASLILISIGILWSVGSPNGALHGHIEPRPGWFIPVWVDVIVPILFVLFIVPGLTYGIVTRGIKNDRDVARMMSETMSSMGSYIVLAFFASQFIAWFGESNLGKLIALQGVIFLRSLNMPMWLFVVSIVALTGFLNLFIGSASAKWALISTVFVPIFAGVGISPELTQAAYRVGDSFTNIIAPLNPYIVIVLVFMQRYVPKAGIGSLISLMLPYSITFGISWIAMLLLWMLLGIPLGPGGSALFLPTF